MSPSRVRKRFGQHFLVDPQVIDEIMTLIAVRKHDHVIEIGPGRGALTAPLLATGARLSIIEIDRDLAAFAIAKWSHSPNLSVHLADVLEIDFTALSEGVPMRVVGNLPYNISTPLILKLIDHTACIQDMTFMLQKEVVDRLAAAPGSKNYGRLSVMVKSRARVEPFFDVLPAAFDPPPRVTSKLVRITPQQDSLSSEGKRKLESCVRIAFAQRRKILKNTLGKEINHDLLARCGIALERRPEEIDVDAYVHLARSLSGD